MITLTKSNSGGSLSITGLADGQERVVTAAGGFSVDIQGIFTLTSSVTRKGLAESYVLGDYTNVTGFASRLELYTYLFEFFGSVAANIGSVRIDDSNDNPITVQNPFPTKPQQNLDAFERLRTSDTDQRVDIEFKYSLQPEIFLPVLVGAGTVTHNALSRDVSIKVNSAVNGDKAEFIQLWDNPYTSGNSQLIEITGTPDLSGVNTLSAEVYLRDAIRGGEEIITQDNWLALNDDRNWDCSHIFLMDFQSLKVGTVRFFMDTDGMAVKVAQINNDNRRANGYWQDPNQPLVWRMYNTTTETITEIGYDDGVNGIGFRFRQPLNTSAECIAICATVKSEGGGNLFEIEGLPVAVDRGVLSKVVGATPVPVLSVRSKLLFKGFTNKTIAIPKLANIQTDNDIQYYFVLGGTLTGAVWVDADTNLSALEYDISATALTGGKKENSDYLATGSKNQTSGEGGFLGKTVLTAARGVQSVFTLMAVRTGGVNATVLSSFGLTEII